MKLSKYLLGCLLFLILILPFAGCENTDDDSHVAPITLYEKVNGNWKLTDLKQIDEDPLKIAGVTKEISLYDNFQFGSFTISLNVEGDMPTSYQVTGTSPELFPKSGYWALDHDFPLTNGTSPKVLLYSDVTKTVQIGELIVASVPGAAPQTMDLRLTRTSNGQPFVSYVYKLQKNTAQ